MKTIIRILPILILNLLLASCHTAESVAKVSDSKSMILYQQALDALENHKFIIEATELYLPISKVSIKSSIGSYISMLGQYAIINFTPDVFPGDPWPYLKIEDTAAEIKTAKIKTNGDLQFDMKIEGNQEWLKRRILITVYKNTNQCFVQVNDRAGTNIINFRGNIYTKAE
ncbi:DUF4251 domain-containing protein [Bacteroides sp.]|uniref:DUF4251 domain-containing protein n=1 Tax=Bacteroides sp. TaxID=29523 RepID=UPI004025D2D4